MGLLSHSVKKFEKNNDINGLLKCLEHGSASTRYSAFVALAHGSSQSAEVVERLKRMVHDPDPWVRTLAVLKFTQLGDNDVSANLLEIMSQGSLESRIELMKIIASRGASEDTGLLQAIVVGLGDKKEVVKIYAISAAASAKSRHLMQYLGDLLHEKHHKIRMKAARALFEIGGDGSADYLIGLLADRNEEVQSLARSFLSKMDIEYVKKALHDAEFRNLIAGLSGREPDREKTARRIGAERIREGLPLLHRSCRDRYKGVRIESLKSMAIFRDQSSIEFAERLLADKFNDVRLEALNTLAAIGGIRAMKAAEIAVVDRNKDVRELAERVAGIKK